ncbi:MAG: SixA phosphatase family protein [Leptospirales bacterium]
MKILLLRHAEAEDAPYPELLRPLTPGGRKSVKDLSREIDRSGLRVDAIVASPLTRAVQTAEILLSRLSDKHPVRRVECRVELACDFLSSTFSRQTFHAFLAGSGFDGLVLVGHEPSLLVLASWIAPSRARSGDFEGIRKASGLLFEWSPESEGIFDGRLFPKH